MATHLHKHVRNVTRKSFEHYGFAYAEILAGWRNIVGDEYAAFCAPERIRWPRGQSEFASQGRRKAGGMLVIRVADGRAVELQHDSSRIIERVNTYYGYEAVTGLSFVQGPLPAPQERAVIREPLSAEREQVLEQRIAPVRNDELRRALRRLGRGAMSRKSAKKGR